MSRPRAALAAEGTDESLHSRLARGGTTELGYMARLKHEFDKRNTKIIGLSIDPVNNHQKWAG
jgi:peroxiredoxin